MLKDINNAKAALRSKESRLRQSEAKYNEALSDLNRAYTTHFLEMNDMKVGKRVCFCGHVGELTSVDTSNIYTGRIDGEIKTDSKKAVRFTCPWHFVEGDSNESYFMTWTINLVKRDDSQCSKATTSR